MRPPPALLARASLGQNHQLDSHHRSSHVGVVLGRTSHGVVGVTFEERQQLRKLVNVARRRQEGLALEYKPHRRKLYGRNITHGTSGYRLGCRCYACREAHRLETARGRAKVKVA